MSVPVVRTSDLHKDFTMGDQIVHAVDGVSVTLEAGEFVALDERDGKTLWSFPMNAIIKTSPMTYTVDGEQYVALAVGSAIMCFGLNR